MYGRYQVVISGNRFGRCERVDRCDWNGLLFHRHDQILSFGSPGRDMDVIIGTNRRDLLHVGLLYAGSVIRQRVKRPTRALIRLRADYAVASKLFILVGETCCSRRTEREWATRANILAIGL